MHSLPTSIMVHLSMLLGLASLTVAHELLGFIAQKGSQANLLLPGANSAALSISAICSSFEDTCDESCIPSGYVCCFEGDGSNCDPGTTCQAYGCCPEDEDCGGEPSGCSSGKEPCGIYCMPTGSVCCEDAGSYCDSGETCTSDGRCEVGSDGGDELAGGSGNCYSFQEECDGHCIPAGSVCCGDGYYCDEGETCASDGTCTIGSGGEDDDENEDDKPQYTLGSPSSTADNPFSLPTFSDPFEDDEDDVALDGEEESTLCKRKGGKGGGGGSFGGGGGGGDGGDDDECGAGSAGSAVDVPTILSGIFAVLPFAL